MEKRFVLLDMNGSTGQGPNSGHPDYSASSLKLLDTATVTASFCRGSLIVTTTFPFF